MDPDRHTGFVYPVKKKGVPVRGRYEVTRAALEAAEEKDSEDAQKPRDNVVALASRRR